MLVFKHPITLKVHKQTLGRGSTPNPACGVKQFLVGKVREGQAGDVNCKRCRSVMQKEFTDDMARDDPTSPPPEQKTEDEAAQGFLREALKIHKAKGRSLS